MKILQSLFILLISISITGCSPDGNNVISLTQFTANVDGVTFNSNEATTTLASGRLGIIANDSNGDVILLSVRDFDGTQSVYDLGASNTIGNGTYSANGENNSFISLLEGGSGSLIITDYDETNSLISGEFEFVAVRESFNDDMTEIFSESVNITSGSFTNIIVGSFVGTDNDNVFSALIDGQIFNPDTVQGISSTIGGNDLLTIAAIDNTTGQNISLNFAGEILIGTFDLEGTGGINGYGAIYNVNINDTAALSTTSLSGTGSTITIDSYDETNGTIEGSFQFTSGDFLGQNPTTFEITDGIFSIDIL